ncbi:MAG: hypothetical protein IPG16_02045 [Comamonadaceae bacterium]|jgi:hypothetical protein|nr:hypothetical protein [Comamonadaceae bacterium]
MVLTSLFCSRMVAVGAQNTTNSGNRARQSCGFFTAIGFYQWPGVRLIKYPKGEYARRLFAVLSPRPPSQNGRNSKIEQEPIMAKPSHVQRLQSIEVADDAARCAAYNLDAIVCLLKGCDELKLSGSSLAGLLRPVLTDMFIAHEELTSMRESAGDAA